MLGPTLSLVCLVDTAVSQELGQVHINVNKRLEHPFSIFFCLRPFFVFNIKKPKTKPPMVLWTVGDMLRMYTHSANAPMCVMGL